VSAFLNKKRNKLSFLYVNGFAPKEPLCWGQSLCPEDLLAPNPRHRATKLIQALPHRIKQVRRLHWGNRWKKTWWRLLLHGVPGACGYGWAWARGASCACRWQSSQAAGADMLVLQIRDHAFWYCLFAQGVVGV